MSLQGLSSGVQGLSGLGSGGGAAIPTPDQISSVNLYLPSVRANWVVNTDGSGGPAALNATIGRIATGKAGTPYANGGTSPTRRSDGIEFIAAGFNFLNLSATLTYAGPFTAWFSFMAPTDAPRLVLVGNSAALTRIEVVAGTIALITAAGTRSVAYAGTGVPALARIRRDASNNVWIAYTGTAEASGGAALATSLDFTQIGYSQGAGGGYGGTSPSTPRFLGWCIANADLVTDSPSSVAAIQADFLAKDAVSL